MQYFFRLVEGIRVLPLMAAIARQPKLWNSDNCRREFAETPHAATDDILLRFTDTGPNGTLRNSVSNYADCLEMIDRPVMAQLPDVKSEILNIMRLVNGSRLGRVIVTRLGSGKKILPHSDVLGEYSKYYTRYHLVLQGMPGSMFNCGDETVNMLTGELWWFDASSEHSVINNSKDDRIHMLIDVRVDA